MKTENKVLSFILFLFLTISISLSIILLNTKLIIFNEILYKNEFVKYDVYSQLKDVNITQINKQVLDYLKYKNKLLESDFFSEREKSHLKDVKSLIQNGNKIFFGIMPIILILIISLFLSLDKKSRVKYLSIILIISGFAILIITLVLVFAVNFNFQNSFDKFHRILFADDTWLFNPEFERIIILYPIELFFDFGIRIFIYNMVGSLILFGVGLVLNKKVFK